MPAKRPPSLRSVLRALANQGLTTQQIQSAASRIAAMSVEEIEMQLFKRVPLNPEPRAEASSELVSLVAKLRTLSRRRTNAEVLRLIADELEDEGHIASAQNLLHVDRETVAQWLARALEVVSERNLRVCLEKLLQSYQSGTRLRRVK